MIEFATIARPYAQALFDLAQQKQQTEHWQQGLAQLAWLMTQSKVIEFINQAVIDPAQKASSLMDLLQDTDVAGSAEFKNFVHVLAQEKRLSVLPEIHRHYSDLVLASNQIKSAVIYTAYEVLDEQQKNEIISDLEQHFNTKLQASFQTDTDLIGGIKVEVGDKVLDLSVKGKLNALHTTMTH